MRSGSAMRTVFVDEAAMLLGVSRRTVYYRIQAGKLQTVRTACGSQRVLIASIEVLLRESRGLRHPGADERFARAPRVLRDRQDPPIGAD